jgi:diguanylate cyclase (GGDEF)-like protein
VSTTSRSARLFSRLLSSSLALAVVLGSLAAVGVVLAVRLSHLSSDSNRADVVGHAQGVAMPAVSTSLGNGSGGPPTPAQLTALDASVAKVIASGRLISLAIYDVTGNRVYGRGPGPYVTAAGFLDGVLRSGPQTADVPGGVRVVLPLPPPPRPPGPAPSAPSARSAASGAPPAPLVLEVVVPFGALGGPGASALGWLLAVGVLALGVTGASLITLQRRMRHQSYQATHDQMTGLGNRTLLDEHADLLRGGAPAALLLMDLDGFKAVNDSLGHAAGDHLLCQVAGALGKRVRPADLLVRLGGDEFAVLLPGADEEVARAAAERLLGAVRATFVVHGVSVDTDGSIGVALAPRDGSTVGELLRAADLAMYAAKRGRLGVSVAPRPAHLSV